MAYVSKEKKAKVAELLKAEFGKDAKKRGFKYSLAVDNSTSLVLTISEGSIDFLKNYEETQMERYGETRFPANGYLQVNEYYLETQFSGKALEIMKRIKDILNTDNFNKSDLMTDYHHVGHYININIGRWNKRFELWK